MYIYSMYDVLCKKLRLSYGYPMVILWVSYGKGSCRSRLLVLFGGRLNLKWLTRYLEWLTHQLILRTTLKNRAKVVKIFDMCKFFGTEKLRK